MPELMSIDGKDAHGNPTFRGSAKGILEMGVELMFKGADWNHTIVKSDKFTSNIEEGCTGSIHRNESDMAISGVEYPTPNFDTVDPYAVSFEEPLAIVSRYNSTDGHYSEFDILNSAVKTLTFEM